VRRSTLPHARRFSRISTSRRLQSLSPIGHHHPQRLTPEARPKLGISAVFCQISAGLEHRDDLIEDFAAVAGEGVGIHKSTCRPRQAGTHNPATPVIQKSRLPTSSFSAAVCVWVLPFAGTTLLK